MSDTRHVQATCGDVGSDNDIKAAITQLIDHLLTLRLRNITVQGSGAVAVFNQQLGHIDGRLLGAHEADQRIEALYFEQTQHYRRLLVSMHKHVRLLDARHGLCLGSNLDVLGLV